MPKIYEHAKNIPRMRIHSFYKNVRLKMPNIYEHAKNIPRMRIHSFYKNVRLKIVQHL